MSAASAAPVPGSRSSFVTVVAWVFIVLAGFATLIAVMQAMMFAFVFPAGEWPPGASVSNELQEMPAAMRFMITHVAWMFAASWFLAVLTLVAAIGLLARRNWARLTFIGLMGIGIAWSLSAIWLQRVIVSSMPKLPSRPPAEIASGFETMATAMGIGMVLFAILISLVLAWIAMRLMSPAIAAEFRTR